MLERSMFAFALLGAEWVLYLLVILSIASVAVMFERAVFYAQRRLDVKKTADELGRLIDEGKLDEAWEYLRTQDAMAVRVAARGLESRKLGPDAIRELMAGELVEQRLRFEKRLIFLGTLGNNAPFIGLFGTVLGIIKAFKDLADVDAAQASSTASVVMAGVSEALVATAVGLAVALPAVVAYNYFKSIVKQNVSSTETLTRVLMARLPALTRGEN